VSFITFPFSCLFSLYVVLDYPDTAYIIEVWLLEIFLNKSFINTVYGILLKDLQIKIDTVKGLYVLGFEIKALSLLGMQVVAWAIPPAEWF
jgi:hypothetical protein